MIGLYFIEKDIIFGEQNRFMLFRDTFVIDNEIINDTIVFNDMLPFDAFLLE